jgi:alpha-glucosidase
MQWDASPTAGFTTSSKPWLPIPPSAATYNVQTEKTDHNSIFNTYKELIALRKSEPALRLGSWQSVDDSNPYVFSFLRRTDDETILVALNMSAEPRTVTLNLSSKPVTGATATTLYASSSSTAAKVPLDHIQLAPFGVLVAKLP